MIKLCIGFIGTKFTLQPRITIIVHFIDYLFLLQEQGIAKTEGAGCILPRALSNTCKTCFLRPDFTRQKPSQVFYARLLNQEYKS